MVETFLVIMGTINGLLLAGISGLCTWQYLEWAFPEEAEE